MTMFSRKDVVKRYLPCLPGRFSSLLVLVFLLASICSTGASSFFWSTAAEAGDSEKVILHRDHPLVREAMEIQHRHTMRLMDNPDVVGTGVGIGPDGQPVIKVFTKRAGVRGIPAWLESIPVHVEVTGMVFALTDPKLRYRPAPIGVSTGHPDITAGTIGARVKDGAGNVYALSNNHVYANQNDANLGDNVLQPGVYDGGKNPADAIGTLFAFEPIDFSFSGENYVDAAIALSSPDLLSNSTPLDDGYGIPSSEIVNPQLNLLVKKYGRTTGLTYGQVSTINSFVEVCYEAIEIPGWGPFCIKSAYFFDQMEISGAGFSAGGDSGSLIVAQSGNNPVGLLFAGSDTTTFANRIDLVLAALGVTIDDGTGETPTPPTAPTGLTAAASSSSQINLTWTDTSDEEAGFKIERCAGESCTEFAHLATVGANITSYSNTGLLGSTSYRYRVRAYNTSGDSDYSNTASATTPAPPALPAAPTGLTATAISRNQINLAWTDNATNEDGFKIERCRGATCKNFSQIAIIVGANATTYSDTNVSPRTTYRYRVRAHNNGGNSAYSNTARATTPR